MANLKSILLVNFIIINFFQKQVYTMYVHVHVHCVNDIVVSWLVTMYTDVHCTCTYMYMYMYSRVINNLRSIIISELSTYSLMN